MLSVALAIALVSQSAQLPTKLDAGSFESVRKYATPSRQDLSFQSLDWHASVFDGINAGRAADKPILLWMYFGDPRGHC